LSGRRLWRTVKLYRLIDAILAGYEGAQSTNSPSRLFYRHGRYFIMAFVAHRAPEIANGVNLALSTAEVESVSRLTNQLSELIYAASVPWQGLKGYLAIFRNLTDAQPLADKVLAQLAANDTAAAQAARTAVQPPATGQQGTTT
jgi:hypothetical protein